MRSRNRRGSSGAPTSFAAEGRVRDDHRRQYQCDSDQPSWSYEQRVATEMIGVREGVPEPVEAGVHDYGDEQRATRREVRAGEEKRERGGSDDEDADRGERVDARVVQARGEHRCVPGAPDQAHDDRGLHFSERKQLREKVAAPAVFLAEGEHRSERQGDESENDVLQRQGHVLIPTEVPPAGDLGDTDRKSDEHGGEHERESVEAPLA
jgi:hypothetical protein